MGVLVIALTGGFAIASPASAAGALYRIKLYGYDRCLDVRGVDPNDGALLQTYSCIAGAANQKFWIDWKGRPGNLNTIAASHSNKCLDVAGVSPYWGANIQQYTCLGWGQGNQVWTKTFQFFDGPDAVVTWTGFAGWCLAAQNWNNGADVRQEDCTNTNRNYWVLTPA